MPVQLTPSIWKSKTGLDFAAFQWKGQPTNTLPGWAAAKGAHNSGGQLHIVTRYGTFAAAMGDWIVQEPDGMPMIVSNSVFQADYVAGP